MTTHLIAGTAGHIDHGKTALIKALTGIDADRLPEEKRRGMTVDLGFASLDLDGFRLGIVDVPGHERFVRNMLVGAMAVDIALLVIAATESIKPQTREHLEILKHAGIEQGIIVLTKCDLVDDEWTQLVEEEVRELTNNCFLRDAPIVRVSSIEGTGLAELRDCLADAAGRAATASRRALVDAPFCMGVDRVFSVDGHGTVVTGSIVSGRLRTGDEVVVAPHGNVARVRRLQSHHATVESIERGQRAAINLAGVPLESIRRGDAIAASGLLSASRSLCAELSFGPEHRARRTRRLPVRIHLGTSETVGSLRWLEHPREEAMIAEVQTDQPVAALAGQPLVVRSQCATITFGGGRVLDPDFPFGLRWSAEDLRQLRQLGSPQPIERVAAALYLNGLAGFDPPALTKRAGFASSPSRLLESLIDQGCAVRLKLGDGNDHVLHALVLRRVTDRIENLLEKQHHRNPLQSAFPVSLLQKIFAPVSIAGLADAVVRLMEEEGRLICLPAGCALPGFAPQLSKKQRQEYHRMIEAHREAAYAPPSMEELISAAHSHRDSMPELVELAIAEGYLVRVCADWCLHWEREQEMLQMIRDSLGESPFAVKDLRDLLGTSRKYLVPLCEHLDRIGFTRRDGDMRTITEPIGPPLTTGKR